MSMPAKSKPKKKIANNSSDLLELLTTGSMNVLGFVPWSSNRALLVEMQDGKRECVAIYKPNRLERPLWDFPFGSLSKRECASYLASTILGWPNIPPTVLRDGPQGEGAVQIYVDVIEDENFFTLRDRFGDEMKRMCVFDAIANNTDRKGGHVLLGKDNQIWSIDHGVTFHEYYKLRTVIWDYVGEEIPPEILSDVRRLRNCFEHDGDFGSNIENLLSRREMNAFSARIDKLLEERVFPEPPEDWPHVPWPPI